MFITNGNLDPWSYGGIGYDEHRKKRLPKNIMWIDGASHHLDLWWPNPNDPPSVINARQTAFDLIEEWIRYKER
jgi:hypothetical protein